MDAFVGLVPVHLPQEHPIPAVHAGSPKASIMVTLHHAHIGKQEARLLSKCAASMCCMIEPGRVHTSDEVEALLCVHDLLQGQQMGVGAHGVHDCNLTPQQGQVVPEDRPRHDLECHLRPAGSVPRPDHSCKVATAASRPSCISPLVMRS